MQIFRKGPRCVSPLHGYERAWQYSTLTNSSNVKIGDLITSRADGKGCGKQGWYDLAFVVSPTNANTMFFGGVNTWGSTDGGRNWTIRNQWTTMASGLVVVHADKIMAVAIKK